MNLTSNSLSKTISKKINLSLFQNLKGTITVKSSVYVQKKIHIKKYYIKETLVKLYNKVLNINPCTGIGTSIMNNAPPFSIIKTSPLTYQKNKTFHKNKSKLNNIVFLFYNDDQWRDSWGEQWYDIYNEDYIYEEDENIETNQKENNKNNKHEIDK